MNDTSALAGNVTLPSQPYLSVSVRAGLVVIYVLTLVVALLGNALSLLIVYRRRSFRNTMNLLIANMCVADMLVVVVIIPFALWYIYRKDEWIGGVGGDIACRIFRYTGVVSIAASILTILFITCERYVAICHPLGGHLLRMPKVVTSLIWILSLAMVSPYLAMYKNMKAPNGKWYCQEDFGRLADVRRYLKIQYLLLFILLYALPLLVITALNSAIVWRLARQQMPGDDHGNGTQSKSRVQAARNRRKAVKMLIMLLIVFACCWLPTHIMHLFITVRRDILVSLPRMLPHVFFWFGYLNSALNPFIYVLFSANFRRDLKMIFLQSRRKKSSIITVKMTLSDGSRDRSGSGLGRFVRWSMRSSVKSSKSCGSPLAVTRPVGHADCVQLEPILRNDEHSRETSTE